VGSEDQPRWRKLGDGTLRRAKLIVVHLSLGLDCSIVTSFSVNPSCSSKVRLTDWLQSPNCRLQFRVASARALVGYAPNAGVEMEMLPF